MRNNINNIEKLLKFFPTKSYSQIEREILIKKNKKKSKIETAIKGVFKKIDWDILKNLFMMCSCFTIPSLTVSMILAIENFANTLTILSIFLVIVINVFTVAFLTNETLI